jgi:hypothetical protein
MMKYKYEIFSIPSGGKDFRIIFENHQYFPVFAFLHSDASQFENWIKQEFDDVLSGKVECVEESGNGTFYSIHKDKTRIELLFPPNDNDEIWCEVDTKELKNLVDEFCEKRREFKKSENIK